MRKLSMVIAAAAMSVGVSGCAIVSTPVAGWVFTDVKHGGYATTAGGNKRGEACAQSILGWVALGDASVEAAKAAGGINNVSVIDHYSHSILGIIGKYCTVVKGS